MPIPFSQRAGAHLPSLRSGAGLVPGSDLQKGAAVPYEEAQARDWKGSAASTPAPQNVTSWTPATTLEDAQATGRGPMEKNRSDGQHQESQPCKWPSWPLRPDRTPVTVAPAEVPQSRRTTPSSPPQGRDRGRKSRCSKPPSFRRVRFGGGRDSTCPSCDEIAGVTGLLAQRSRELLPSTELCGHDPTPAHGHLWLRARRETVHEPSHVPLRVPVSPPALHRRPKEQSHSWRGRGRRGSGEPGL